MPPQQNPSQQTATRLDSIIRQSSVILAGKVSFFCLGLVSSVALARILGAESLGRFQLGLVTVQVTTVFCVAGFDKGLTRFLPLLEMKAPGRIRGLLASNFFLTLVLSLFFVSLIFVLAPWLATHYFRSPVMKEVLQTFCFYLPVLALVQVGTGALIGSKRADLASNVANILTPLVYLASLLLVTLLGGGLSGCIGARITTHLVALLLFLGFLVKRYRPTQAPRQGSEYSLKSYLSFSTPLILISLIYLLLGQMDIIMLGYFVSVREVGLYSVAAKLAILVLVGLEIFLPILGPHLSELSSTRDHSTIGALFKSTTKWTFYGGLLVFGLFSVMRSEVLAIYGHEFSAGAGVLLILLAGQLANALTGPTGQLLVMSGNQRWEVLNSVSVVVLNFLLNLLLIPAHGTLGAAIATASSVTAINVVKLLEVYLIFSLSPYRPEFLKGVVGAVAGCLVCYYLRLLLLHIDCQLFLTVGLCGLAFLATFLSALWLLGFSAEDKMIVEMLFRKFQGGKMV